MERSLETLLEATRTSIRANAVGGESACAEVALLRDLVEQPTAQADVSPATTAAVEDHLRVAVEAARQPHVRALADALLAATPALRWISTYASDSGAGEMANGYASTLLIGTGARVRDYQPPFVNPNVMVAFTIQRPHLQYPTHHHKASEIYHVISGRAEWQRGDEPWRWREPGEWFFHESEQGHAMRTHDAPLLSLAAWIDHLDAPPPTLTNSGGP